MSQSESITSNREFLDSYIKTGPGSLAGAMLRHYWHPVCLSDDLKDVPYAVRMLGEDLVAFRGLDGKTGLIGAYCPHRGAALEYAHVCKAGLQCSYHGWVLTPNGRCADMPLEPATSTIKDEIRQAWYPTKEWGGVVWCYMGAEKENPPPLPKIDLLARTDGEISLSRGDIREYSYLNFLENFVDVGHAYILHMLLPPDIPPEVAPFNNDKVDAEFRNATFKVVETPFGLKSVIVHNTSNPDFKFMNTWSLALPTFYRFSGLSGGAGLPPDFTDDRLEGGGFLRIIDDGHFEMFRYSLRRPGNYWQKFRKRGANNGSLSGRVAVREYDKRKYAGFEGLPREEDLVMQESQGVQRRPEFLVSSDAGVAMLRRLYRNSMQAVANGGRPKPVVTNEDGIIELDTFKGTVRTADAKIGPENMPSSERGRGLIRDGEGRLVFD